jgi:hypothetical protein
LEEGFTVDDHRTSRHRPSSISARSRKGSVLTIDNFLQAERKQNGGLRQIQKTQPAANSAGPNSLTRTRRLRHIPGARPKQNTPDSG